MVGPAGHRASPSSSPRGKWASKHGTPLRRSVGCNLFEQMPKRRRDEESDSSESDDDSEVQNFSLTPNTKLVGEGELPRLPSKYAYNNKQRVLVIASRGITARYRHLLEDLKKLVPHHKTDSKLDDKGDVHAVNEIAEVKSCNQILYLETRKHSDLFMYLGRTPNGPSVKFQVVNVHTMDELKLTGNCMLGSRPLLDFDSAFERAPHLQLMKAMLMDVFGTPLGHPKSKPFLDRIMCFYLVKNNIWVRNYQIVDSSETSKEDGTTLVEIGPRFVLIPIRIFMGSLGGPTLYQNMSYVSPNTERSIAKKAKGNRYAERVQHNAERKQFLAENQMPRDELSSKNVFANDDDDEDDDA